MGKGTPEITQFLYGVDLESIKQAYRSFISDRPVQHCTIDRHLIWLNSVLVEFVGRFYDVRGEHSHRKRKASVNVLGKGSDFYSHAHTRDDSEAEESSSNEQDERKHRFSNVEVAKLFSSCDTTMEHLVLGLLFTTGMRLGGIVRIKTRNVAIQEAEKWDNFSTGQTSEKGRKRKQFTIQPVVRAYLLRWLIRDRPLSVSKYLFPSCTSEAGHLARSTIQQLFMRVAKRANVTGPHVHVHTTRHTVAFELFEAGNRLEHVAKFLGHSPAGCEKFYQKFCHADVMRHINSDVVV